MTEGDDVAIIATRVMVAKALEASEMLAANKISAAVYSMSTVKSIDRACVLEATHPRYGVVTVEDHNLSGGFGEAVAAIIASENPIQVLSVGIPDIYPIIGEPEDLYRHYQMDAAGIAGRCLALTGV
jgi:transketolase